MSNGRKKSAGRKKTSPKVEEPKEEISEEAPPEEEISEEPSPEEGGRPEGWKEVLFSLVSGPATRDPKGLAESLNMSQAKVNGILEALQGEELVVLHKEQWFATEAAHDAIAS